MAKNFGKSPITKAFSDTANKSNEKAQVITLIMISNDNLLDYPNNNEDIKDTTDLENSMKEIGFTDPLEVTKYGVEDGKYMIVSGHRRRAAGVEIGIKTFPCIVKSFNSENDIKNYVLLSNSQRDSSKDPLLYCKRYKMHEQYLIDSDFKGSFREEIATRLGISVQQADRYNKFNNVILPVWDMVRNGEVGMSSVLPMASHGEEEQEIIYGILKECIQNNVELTRSMVKMVIDRFREGKNTYDDIFDDDVFVNTTSLLKDSGLPINSFVNDNNAKSRDNEDDSKRDRNDETRREFDHVANEADLMDSDREKWEEDRLRVLAESEKKDKEEKANDKEFKDDDKVAKDIIKYLDKLNTCFNNQYSFEDAEEATDALRSLANTFEVVIDEMYEISSKFELKGVYKELLDSMNEKVKSISIHTLV